MQLIDDDHDEFSPSHNQLEKTNKVHLGGGLTENEKPIEISLSSPQGEFSSGTLHQSPIVEGSPEQRFLKKNSVMAVRYGEVGKEQKGRYPEFNIRCQASLDGHY
jgi:hypothetical protein